MEAKLTSGVHQTTPNAKKTISKKLERVIELRDKITDVDEEITQIEKGKNADSALLSQ